MSNLQKAEGFYRDKNYLQTLRYSELALLKLKQLTYRPIDVIDSALRLKFNALIFMDRNREALECAQERYCLYLTQHTHPPAIEASFDLIESCIHNKEYEEAALYARTTWETITLSRDSHIPDADRQDFTARGAYYLAKAMLALAEHGNIPPEANQTVGQEAIGLARRSLEDHTQLYGLEHANVANAISLLARVLNYFNIVDDDEVLRLYEQSIAIFRRVEGNLSVNIAAGNRNLATAYYYRARRANAADDLDREFANLELALPLYSESVRLYRYNNFAKDADDVASDVVTVEEELRQCRAARSSSSSSSSSAGVATRG